MKTCVTYVIPLLLLFAVSCGSKMDDVMGASKNKIRTYLHGQKIYDLSNLPEPEPADIKGDYSIVGGAYRWIFNQDDDGRELKEEVHSGDIVHLRFDGRIFTTTFDVPTSFYTNDPTRIDYISGANGEFDSSNWSTDPLVVEVGSGQLLSALDGCLPGCRQDDILRIFLTPKAGYGGIQIGYVPAYSTLAFGITIENVIKK